MDEITKKKSQMPSWTWDEAAYGTVEEFIEREFTSADAVKRLCNNDFHMYMRVMQNTPPRGRLVELDETVLGKKLCELFPGVVEVCALVKTMFKDGRKDSATTTLNVMLGLSDPEILLAWSLLTGGGVTELEFAKFVHPIMAHKVLSIFGVPMGAAGIGVVPGANRQKSTAS